MTRYLLFTTKQCRNNCVICAIDSPVVPNFYSIGKTETERKAIRRLYTCDVGRGEQGGIDGCLTGGDPLRNLNALEVIAELSREDGTRRNIVINPISFQKMDDDKKERVLGSLKEFGVLCSYGDSRGSYPGENEEARQEWEELSASHKIKYKNKFPIKARLEEICGGLRLGKGKDIRVVGRLRREIERGRITAPVHYPGILDRGDCCYADKSTKRVLFFEKVGGKVKLARSLCCGTGINKYVTHRTDISVDDLAGIKNSMEVYFKINIERNKFFRKLSYLIEIDGGNANFYLFKFDKIARDLIWEKTGEKVDNLLATTPTMQEKVKKCEYCHSIALALHGAGISREEFHDYVEERKRPLRDKFLNLLTIGAKYEIFN